ncbi:hypothetical protein GN244_ATG11369 [Phytophthora infestans]|uniref:Uncharacterized protein n=1 Tax=Phytophthora infestans TaxID=4787 RepID=A0A833SRJ4_PHYIN|nr:hypothetical protein GN244_ATG11369 [Phytophthora infestans]
MQIPSDTQSFKKRMISEIFKNAGHLIGVIRGEAPTDKGTNEDFSDLTKAELMEHETLNDALGLWWLPPKLTMTFCLLRPRTSKYKLHASK